MAETITIDNQTFDVVKSGYDSALYADNIEPMISADHYISASSTGVKLNDIKFEKLKKNNLIKENECYFSLSTDRASEDQENVASIYGQTIDELETVLENIDEVHEEMSDYNMHRPNIRFSCSLDSSFGHLIGNIYVTSWGNTQKESTIIKDLSLSVVFEGIPIQAEKFNSIFNEFRVRRPHNIKETEISYHSKRLEQEEIPISFVKSSESMSIYDEPLLIFDISGKDLINDKENTDFGRNHFSERTPEVFAFIENVPPSALKNYPPHEYNVSSVSIINMPDVSYGKFYTFKAVAKDDTTS